MQHVINRQVFEFTCSNELMAKNIQHEFIQYTAVQVNKLIADILTAQVQENNILTIQELEIDLGDIPVQAFGNDEMLEKFRAILSEKIAGIQHMHATATGDEGMMSASEADMELTKSLILYGDIPWWADKDASTDADAIMQKLLSVNPRAVQSFLVSQRGNRDALVRIATQYTWATRLTLQSMVPGLQPDFIGSLLEEYTHRSDPFMGLLSAEATATLLLMFTRQAPAVAEEGKTPLIRRLLKNSGPDLVKIIARFGFFSAAETEEIAAVLQTGNATKPFSKKKLATIFQKLSVAQIGFLHYYLSQNRPLYLQEAAASQRIAAEDTYQFTGSESAADTLMHRAPEPAYLQTGNRLSSNSASLNQKPEDAAEKSREYPETRMQSYPHIDEIADRTSNDNSPTVEQSTGSDIAKTQGRTDEPVLHDDIDDRTRTNSDISPESFTTTEQSTGSDLAKIQRRTDELELPDETTGKTRTNNTISLEGFTTTGQPIGSDTAKSQGRIDEPVLHDDTVDRTRTNSDISPESFTTAEQPTGADIAKTQGRIDEPVLHDDTRDRTRTSNDISPENFIKAAQQRMPDKAETPQEMVKAVLPGTMDTATGRIDTTASVQTDNQERQTMQTREQAQQEPVADTSPAADITADAGTVSRASVNEGLQKKNDLAGQKNVVFPLVTDTEMEITGHETEPVTSDAVQAGNASHHQHNAASPVPPTASAGSTAENSIADSTHMPVIPQALPASISEAVQNDTEHLYPLHLADTPVAEQTHTGKALKKSRLIVFIMNALHSADPELFIYLQKLSPDELQELKKNFPHHTRKNNTHRKNVERLLDHPFLLQYNLAAIFATFSFPETPGGSDLSGKAMEGLSAPKTAEPGQLISNISIAQSLFIAVLKNLPLKEMVILDDIFQKKTVDSKSEKNLLKKILLHAPEKAVLFMEFMTGLTETELGRLQPPDSRQVFAGNRFQEEISFIAHEEGNAKKFYIANAGLCLVAPYLSGLFNNLGYIEKRVFKNKALLTRAVALLQYIATGRPASPEYVLQLNKLLCGIMPQQSIALQIRLTKKEKAEADGLLEAVIANWPALKNTSVQGFREAFVQRKGILFPNELSWSLQVEKKGHDMLLSTIPWGFNMIRLPWMKKMIQVEW